jgi:hypothetical protein
MNNERWTMHDEQGSMICGNWTMNKYQIWMNNEHGSTIHERSTMNNE